MVVEPIMYYPKAMGARNTIHPVTEDDRIRLIKEIQDRGGVIMSSKIKALEAETIINRVHELMAEGKESKTRGWKMSDIVNTIEKEQGSTQSMIAFQYIIDNYGVQ